MDNDQSVIEPRETVEHVVAKPAHTQKAEVAQVPLWESREMLRGIVAASPVAIVTMDMNFLVTSWNPAAESMFGWKKEEVLGKLVPHVPPDKLAESRDFRRRILMGQAFEGVEAQRVRKDGTPIEVVISSAPLREESGRIRGVLAVYREVTARKRVEAALVESERRARRLAQFLENSSQPFAMVYPDGRYGLFNKAACKLVGYSAEELQNLDEMNDLTPPEWKAQTQSALAKLQATGMPQRFEKEFLRKDGSRVPVELMLDAVFDEKGQVQYYCGFATDITERKEAEAALRASEARAKFLADLLENVSQPFGIGYPDGRIGFVNKALCELLDRSLEELAELTWYDLSTAEWHEAEKAATAEVRRTRQSQQFIKEYLRKDGSRVLVEVLLTPVFNAKGELDYFYGFVTDVTDRKRIEEALSMQARVLETMAEGVCVFTEAGTITWTNPRFDEIFGYEQGELVGQSCQVLNTYPPEVTEKLIEAIMGQLRQKGTWMGEVSNRKKDGTPFTTFARIHSVESSGRRLGVAVQEDITARKEAEAKLQNNMQKLEVLSQKLVETQERERRHIARELHDQAGQVLTAVQLNLQAALRRAEAKEVTALLGESLGAVDQVLQMVHDLSLDLRPPILDDLGLQAAVRWYTHRQAAQGQVQCEFHGDLQGRLEPIIETACFRIAQEALTNVVRHARAQKVVVELRKTGDLLHLHVRDDGVGFDAAAARKRAARGASLGLLGMEERAVLAGGGLQCKAQPGQGAEVHAWFPCLLRKQTESSQGGSSL